jgi:hypothetical protein
MALFGGRRDAQLVTSMNRELINRIINTEVTVYQLSTQLTRTNIYGESTKKVFYNPVRFNCLISRTPKEALGDDTYTDYSNTATFAFLRSDLQHINLVLNIGDIIKWDTDYYELNLVFSNQYWAGKNPETYLPSVVDKDREFGLNVSVKAEGYKTTADRLNLEFIEPVLDFSIYDFPNKY